MALCADSPDALYQQLAADLRLKIKDGTLPPGSRIPSELELTRQYGVSRVTVRQALEILNEEGLIKRSQGKGTFVALRPPLQEELEGMASLSDVFYQHGVKPTVEVLDLRLVAAEGQVPENLCLRPGTPVLYVLRRHSVNGEPIALAHIYIPGEYGKQMSPRDLEAYTTYWLLEHRCGVVPEECMQTIKANAATRHDSTCLSVRDGSPLLVMERTTYSREGLPIEYIVIRFVGERYRYRVRLRRGGSPEGGSA